MNRQIQGDALADVRLLRVSAMKFVGMYALCALMLACTANPSGRSTSTAGAITLDPNIDPRTQVVTFVLRETTWQECKQFIQALSVSADDIEAETRDYISALGIDPQRWFNGDVVVDEDTARKIFMYEVTASTKFMIIAQATDMLMTWASHAHRDELFRDYPAWDILSDSSDASRERMARWLREEISLSQTEVSWEDLVGQANPPLEEDEPTDAQLAEIRVLLQGLAVSLPSSDDDCGPS